MYKYLLMLVVSTAFGSNLRTTDFQQSLNARALRNYIKNSGAEKNTLNVTASGGTLARSTSTPIEGDASFVVTGSAGGQTFTWAADDFQAGVLGQTCEALFYYTGTGSGYKAYVKMAGVQVSDTATLLDQTTVVAPVSLLFPCGTSTTDDPTVVIESLSSSSALRVDSVYLGRAVSIGSSAQAQVVVAATLSGDQSISSTNPTTLVFDTASKNVYGELNTSTGVTTVKRAGTIVVSAQSRWSNFTTADTNVMMIRKNGSNVCRSALPSSTIQATLVMAGCSINVVAGDTIDLQVDSSTDSSYTIVSSIDTYVTMQWGPGVAALTTVQTTQDLSGFGKSAATANCSWTSTSGSMAAFSADSDCPTITTSGNVSAPGTKIPAVVATSILPGRYKVEVSGLIASLFTTTSTTCNFEIHDGTSSGGIITLVKSEAGTQQANVLVGQFEYTSTQTSKTFQVRAQRSAGGGTCSLDGTTNDVIFNLIPINQGLPKPYVTGSTFFGRPYVVKKGFTQLNCDSSSAITSNPDSMVSSIGNVSSGACTVTLNTGYFSTLDGCILSRQSSSATSDAILRANAASATSVVIGCKNDTNTDCTAYDVYMECTGS